MGVWYKELDKKFSWSFFGFLVGILGVFFGLYSILHIEKPKIQFEILTNTDVINLSEDVGKLEVLFNNQSVLTADTTLKILTIKISNAGNVNIKKDFFDIDYLPGFEIKNGKIADIPTIIDFSNNYLKELFKFSNDSSKLTINPIILDSEDFVTLKLLLVGQKEKPLEINAFGKIAGQNTIPVISEIKKGSGKSFWARLNDDNIWIKLARYFYYTFAFILFVLIFIMPISLISDNISHKRTKRKIENFKSFHEIGDDKNYKMTFHLFNEYGINALKRIIELSNDSELLNKFAHADFHLKGLTYNDLDLIGIPLRDNIDFSKEFRTKSFFDELLIEKDFIVGEFGKKSFNQDFVDKVKRFKTYMEK